MRDALAQIDRVEKEVASGTPRAEAERTVQEERPSKPVQYLDSVSAWSRFKLWLLSRLEKR